MKVKKLLCFELAQLMAKVVGRTQSLGKFPLFSDEDQFHTLEAIDQAVNLIYESIEKHQQTGKKG